MKNLERRYKELKKRVLELKAAKNRAEGALEQTKKALKEEFGVENLKEARSLLKKMKIDNRRKEREFDRLLKRFEKKWERSNGDNE